MAKRKAGTSAPAPQAVETVAANALAESRADPAAARALLDAAVRDREEHRHRLYLAILYGQHEGGGDPLEKRIAKGNPSRRPLPANAPAHVSGMPEPPDWLQGHALDCWRKTAAILAARGQLSADSELSLLALCATYAEWVELAWDIRDHGRFQRVKTKAGGRGKAAAYMERTRPACAMFADADRRLKGWLIEFGLTDASRGKVSGTPPEEGRDDPLRPYGLN